MPLTAGYLHLLVGTSSGSAGPCCDPGAVSPELEDRSLPSRRSDLRSSVTRRQLDHLLTAASPALARTRYYSTPDIFQFLTFLSFRILKQVLSDDVIVLMMIG